MKNNLPRLADQDREYVWTYRVIGSSSHGSVTGTEVVELDSELEAAHDRIMAIPGTRHAETMGPFRTRRIHTVDDEVAALEARAAKVLP